MDQSTARVSCIGPRPYLQWPILTELGRSFSSTTPELATEQRHKLFDLRLGLQVLGVEIGRVELPGDLPHLKLAMSNPLLLPQAGAFQVPQFAQDLSAAYADGHGAVSP